jgi:GNAT superfamily N-acetyltransferase
MEPQKIEINGYQLLIKLMNASYIVCEDEVSQNIKVDVECRPISPCWPNPFFSTYYRKLLAASHVGPVMVWHHKRIVGFLPMSVPGCGIPQLPLCVHYTGGITYAAEKHVDLLMIKSAEPKPFDQLDLKEIRIGCMSVHHTLRGHTLAALMIQYMIDWARQNNWDRVIARVILDGEPMSYYPTESFWIRIGFNPIGPVRSFGLTDDPYDRAQAIDLEFDLKK